MIIVRVYIYYSNVVGVDDRYVFRMAITGSAHHALAETAVEHDVHRRVVDGDVHRDR